MNLSQNNETALRFENSDIQNEKMQNMFGNITLDKVFGILGSENPIEGDPKKAHEVLDEGDPKKANEVDDPKKDDKNVEATNESDRKNVEEATKFCSDFFEDGKLPQIIENALKGQNIQCMNMDHYNHYVGTVKIGKNIIRWVDASTVGIESGLQPKNYLRIQGRNADAFIDNTGYLYTSDGIACNPDGSYTFEGIIDSADPRFTENGNDKKFYQWIDANKSTYNKILKNVNNNQNSNGKWKPVPID